MRIRITIWIICFVSITAVGQTSRADAQRLIDRMPKKAMRSTSAIANYIDKHVEGEELRAFAAYYFVATYLTYSFTQAESVTMYSSERDVVHEALSQRIGVCQHYAELLHAIYTDMGLSSATVAGYTRQMGAVILTPHAWNVVRINDHWHFLDPTWASGYESNDGYNQVFSDQYFMMTPATTIKTHYPYDPLFQLNDTPYSAKAFSRGIHHPAVEQTFVITAFEQYLLLDERDQIAQAAKRIADHGVENESIEVYENYLQRKLEVYHANDQVEKHNIAIEKLNRAVRAYNAYVANLNRHRGVFQGTRAEQLVILQDIQRNIFIAEEAFNQVVPTMKMQLLMYKNKQLIDDIKKKLKQDIRKIKNR